MENNRAYLLRTEITKSHLNNRICQHCGVKTSTVTPYFYYVFNISLSCNINIPSFTGNLWWVLLLGNHLKPILWWSLSSSFVISHRQPFLFSCYVFLKKKDQRRIMKVFLFLFFLSLHRFYNLWYITKIQRLRKALYGWIIKVF